MQLSIIIPSLNEEENIVSLLKTLQYLRQLNHEIILADGGSADRTIEYAEKWVDYIVVSKKGRAIQQNTGAKIANGDWFLFLHADTFLHPNFLDEILKVDQLHQYNWRLEYRQDIEM